MMSAGIPDHVGSGNGACGHAALRIEPASIAPKCEAVWTAGANGLPLAARRGDLTAP